MLRQFILQQMYMHRCTHINVMYSCVCNTCQHAMEYDQSDQGQICVQQHNLLWLAPTDLYMIASSLAFECNFA